MGGKFTRNIRSLIPYLITIGITIVILILVLHLWNFNISIPFTYGGDAFLSLVIIKSIVDHGWYFVNNSIGMPTGQEFYDFPMADNFNLLIIKLISYFSPNSGSVMNVFYLLTFPMTAIASLITLKKFIKSNITAITGSLLFTFLPYHFLRGEPHLLLSAYYMIPFVVLIILWLSSEKDLITESTPFLKNISKKMLVSILICFIVSSTGVYYAVFSCFFLAVVGITSALYFRSMKKIIVTAILIGVIFIGLLANFAPNLIYMAHNGKNPEVGQRGVGESEIYGLKVTQLLLPTDNYRIPKIAYLKKRYIESTPLNTENSMASLGIIGSIGFLFLIIYLFFVKKDNMLHNLSIVNISAILLSTIGGLGTLVAFLISPEIRAYNRISIFIAFFSLFTLFLVFERFRLKFINNKKKNLIYSGFILLILCVGMLDQTNPSDVPSYQWNASEYNNDENFVKNIESIVPINTEIFQLPYVPFPENPPVINLGDYELFRGYLHSTSLKWSYGAMKGRVGDLWQKNLSTKPLNAQLETLSYAGFGGIYLDRYGYADGGADIEAKIFNILQEAPTVSGNKRQVFYDLKRYNEKLRSQYSDAEWEKKKNDALHPLTVSWNGCYDQEGTVEKNWRWCNSQGELTFHNTSNQAKIIKMDMQFATGYDNFSTIQINGGTLNEKLNINSTGISYSKSITIPPGEYKINLKSNAADVIAPNDARKLVFRIMNFQWKENE
jgi:phosphoglycerol transferase